MRRAGRRRPGAADRPQAAEELQSHVLLHPLDLPDAAIGADLAGGAHVRAAAGAAIEVSMVTMRSVPSRSDGLRSPAPSPPPRTGPRPAGSRSTTSLARASASTTCARRRRRARRGRGWRSPGRNARSRSRVRRARRSRRRAGAGRCAAACGRSGGPSRPRRRPGRRRRATRRTCAMRSPSSTTSITADVRRRAGVEWLAAGGGVEGGAVEVDRRPASARARRRAASKSRR